MIYTEVSESEFPCCLLYRMFFTLCEVSGGPYYDSIVKIGTETYAANLIFIFQPVTT